MRFLHYFAFCQLRCNLATTLAFWTLKRDFVDMKRLLNTAVTFPRQGSHLSACVAFPRQGSHSEHFAAFPRQGSHLRSCGAFPWQGLHYYHVVAFPRQGAHSEHIDSSPVFYKISLAFCIFHLYRVLWGAFCTIIIKESVTYWWRDNSGRWFCLSFYSLFEVAAVPCAFCIWFPWVFCISHLFPCVFLLLTG